jgi:hypothetical protein
MNAKIGTEAAQVPEKEYINGFFVAVPASSVSKHRASKSITSNVSA